MKKFFQNKENLTWVGGIMTLFAGGMMLVSGVGLFLHFFLALGIIFLILAQTGYHGVVASSGLVYGLCAGATIAIVLIILALFNPHRESYAIEFLILLVLPLLSIVGAILGLIFSAIWSFLRGLR